MILNTAAQHEVEPGGWLRPASVEVEGNELVWTMLGPSSTRRVRQVSGKPTLPSRQLLDDFAALASASPTAIREFARRWGVLDLCEHRLPRGHVALAPGTGVGQLCGARGVRPHGRETSAEWHDLSSRVSALLRVIDAVRANPPTRGAAEDLKIGFLPLSGIGAPMAHTWPPQLVHHHPDELGGQVSPDNVADAWRRLTAVINEWLEVGGVRIVANLPDGTPRLQGMGLVGGVAVQLLFAASNPDGLRRGEVRCAGCSTNFYPERRPQAGKRAFCGDCRAKKVSKAISNADWSRRNPRYYYEYRQQRRKDGKRS